jgi:putative flavoprotein involved in K+ transport
MLQQHGVQPLVLERSDQLGESWLRHYDRLRLHTTRSMSGLPGYPIPQACGKWVSKSDLAEYLACYARKFQIQPRLGVTVESISRVNSHWVLQTSAGPTESENVIIATGAHAAPYTPPWPGLEKYQGQFLHASQFCNGKPYCGRDVLVIGCGNSAAEILAELAESEAGRLRMAIRTPPNVIAKQIGAIPTQVLGLAFGSFPPALVDVFARLFQKLTIGDLRRYGLPWPQAGIFTASKNKQVIPVIDTGFVSHIKAGRIECVSSVREFSPSGVILSDGKQITPDTVIAATGYRSNLERLVGYLGVLDEQGMPRRRDSGPGPALPGLYFIGFTIEISGVLRRIGAEAINVARLISTKKQVRATASGALA